MGAAAAAAQCCPQTLAPFAGWHLRRGARSGGGRTTVTAACALHRPRGGPGRRRALGGGRVETNLLKRPDADNPTMHNPKHVEFGKDPIHTQVSNVTAKESMKSSLVEHQQIQNTQGKTG
ncbi:uncharacterized protein A4U43_C03F30910 [Asparagus officinalis]|uniref:Uncharacterized protein n=1 Tax=Asparagus officinalis TaxID=4686 RepID=A0A5P1FIF4_ASPOF|nr:uncharacterized protein A4U43_C03F30910 [Asparagus officinalis]